MRSLLVRSRLALAVCALALAVGAVGAAAALADVIHLNSGGLIRGEIVGETEDEVTVKTLVGMTRVLRDDIDRIERADRPEDLLEKKRAALEPGDVRGLFELAAWADKLRLEDERRALLEEVIALEPNHSGARQGLGYVLRQGQWLTAEQATTYDRKRGLLSADDPEAEAEFERRLRQRNVAPTLARQLKDIRKQLSTLDAGVRKQGLDALVRLPQAWRAEKIEQAERKGEAPPTPDAADAFAREAAAAAADLLADLTSKLRRRFPSAHRQVASWVPDFSEKDLAKRHKLLDEWKQARKAALDVIFDLEIYPDENHGAVGQPTVDEKVVVVTTKQRTGVYDRLQMVLLSDLAALIGRSQDAVAEDWATYDGARAAIADLDQALAAARARLGEQTARHPEPLDELTVAQRALLLYRAGHIREAYALEKQLRPWEGLMLERLRDVRVIEFNDAWVGRRQAPEQGQVPTALEREQVKITNAYRMAMGIHALEIHPCLVESARGHSNEMTRLGYFAHDSPVAERRTPSQRAALAGYPGGAAENISLGSVAPQATHDAWYNSSGHHRNILSRGHQCMGSGQDGKHWTQNFGSTRTFER